MKTTYTVGPKHPFLKTMRDVFILDFLDQWRRLPAIFLVFSSMVCVMISIMIAVDSIHAHMFDGWLGMITTPIIMTAAFWISFLSLDYERELTKKAAFAEGRARGAEEEAERRRDPRKDLRASLWSALEGRRPWAILVRNGTNPVMSFEPIDIGDDTLGLWSIKAGTDDAQRVTLVQAWRCVSGILTAMPDCFVDRVLVRVQRDDAKVEP